MQEAVIALGLAGPVDRARRLASPSERRRMREDRDRLAVLRPLLKEAGVGLSDSASRAKERVLVVGWHGVSNVVQQAPLLAGLIRTGYAPVVILGSRAYSHAIEIYRLFGVHDFDFWTRPSTRSGIDPAEGSQALKDQRTLLDFGWNGTRLGRYVLSTLMRHRRSGRIDFADRDTRTQAQTLLRKGLRHIYLIEDFLLRWDPVGAVLDDRGYIPQGLLFDACINRDLFVVTWNAAHRDSTQIFKRYTNANRDIHPSSLSPETWNRLCRETIPEAIGDKVMEEIDACYRSGEWYGEVGTQFNVSVFSEAEVRAHLGLSGDRKTVLVFPHIFWDGTFFWGEDLFGDYEEWFVETMKAAFRNDRVDWIVKVHPANRVKDARDGVRSSPSELQALSSIGKLPSHIRVLMPDTPISTLGLFRIGDYCLTVRGTVGIEAACHGLRVVTAGTGRYDGLGFTLNPCSREDYVGLLERIEKLPPLEPEEIDRARLFAYGIFLKRPLRLKSIRFSYRADDAASMELDLSGLSGRRLIESEECVRIAEWLASGAEDFIDRQES